ncbi:MAG: TerB family tellurite resistance protein [Crocinitomicaceae bacterium]|nr:TerB family tellurite resistance protein [Crocinitomicaceae bacterium]
MELLFNNSGSVINTGILQGPGIFEETLVILVAAVIKADGKITAKEIDIVKRRLHSDYFSGDYNYLLKKLQTELDKEKIHFETKAAEAAKELSASDKVQLLHLLVRIAVSDGLLTITEESVLQQITAKLEVPYRTLDSILAMHRFKREQDEQDRQNYQERKKYTSVSQLENAYKILELTAASTEIEIKKSYKRLAILHHPDKVAHLGEEHQKTAAEKFKIIVGAYDLICKKRNIV